MSAAKKKIERNLQQIRDNISAACKRVRRSPGEVTLLAVTKSADLEQVKAVVDLGVHQLAESRVQQLQERQAEIAQYLQRRKGESPLVQWHMVGHLQRNKVKSLLDCGVETIHSVDSLRLAEEISERAEKLGKTIDVLMEVNCSQETQKFGVAVGAAHYLAELVCTLSHLRLVGLMTMAPQTSDLDEARVTFVRLRELFEELQHDRVGGRAFRHLSMGMSQDYTVAIEEGATILRIGSAIFG